MQRDVLPQIAGDWAGVNRLWLSPQDSAKECVTTASVIPAAGGRFVMITYTWSYEDQPHDGVLLMATTAQDAADAVWIDSFHMSEKMMLCRADGAVPSFRGTYAAPPGPDWGWRIAVESTGADAFTLTMYNIPPGADEELAVEAKYRRG